jgi:NAD(P)-dependent dehydrogenase (short-subunit alcohol dehydrogenase family)
MDDIGMTTATTPVAIITGAARGIGRAMALRFARDGYRVVIADTDADGASRVAVEIEAADGTALGLRIDVSAEEDANACISRTIDAFGRVDVLINNAALFADVERKLLWDVDVAEWDRLLAVNLRGTWLMMKAAAAHFREQRSGSIINMSSNTFLSGRSGFPHYVSSKAAIIGLTRVAARDFGPYDVRVNCIMPGLTKTEVSRPGDVPFEAVLAMQSLARVETPEDIVGVAAFLASDDARFMTGTTLLVSGGAGVI